MSTATTERTVPRLKVRYDEDIRPRLKQEVRR